MYDQLELIPYAKERQEAAIRDAAHLRLCRQIEGTQPNRAAVFIRRWINKLAAMTHKTRERVKTVEGTTNEYPTTPKAV